MVAIGVRRIVVVITLVVSWFFILSIEASPEGSTGVRRIRVIEPCQKTLLEDASRQSSTVRGLVARIERSDLIVYVRCVAFKRTSLLGRLMFLTAAGGHRYVVIELKILDEWSVHVATVAHELQHAVEVAEAPWVQNQATMARYYRENGIIVASRPLIFDTEAARRIGLSVQREVSGNGVTHLAAVDRARMREPRDLSPPH